MKGPLKRRLRSMEAWLDARPLRERVLVCAALLVVMGAAWVVLLRDPLVERRGVLAAEASGVEQEVAELEAQGAEIRTAHETDPNQALRERSLALRSQIAGLDAHIQEHTVTMVSPPAMARFLEEMLGESADLRLVRLENLGAEPMLEDFGDGKTARTGVYRHDFEVELRGRYLSTLRYLEALENLPWNFFWEGLDYEVEEYPEGRATLRAYTLSSEEGWVGA